MSSAVAYVDPQTVLKMQFEGMTQEEIEQSRRLQGALRPSGLSASQSVTAPGAARPGTPMAASAPPSPQRMGQAPAPAQPQQAPAQPPPQPQRRPPPQPSNGGLPWGKIAIVSVGVVGGLALLYYVLKPPSLLDQISAHPHQDSIMKEALLRKAKRELRSKLAK